MGSIRGRISNGRRRVLLAAALVALAVPAVAHGVGEFSDVPAGYAHEEGIEFVGVTGISSGYDDGTYRPGQPVTRGQMATFLRRTVVRTAAAGVHVRHQAGQSSAQIVDAFNHVNQVAPSIVTAGAGNYLINLGFSAADKMYQVTMRPTGGNFDVIASAGPAGPSGNVVAVNLYDVDQASPVAGEFYLFVYGY